MSCWCGHGPWHHGGYPYPPYPPEEYWPPPRRFGPPPQWYAPPAGYRTRRREAAAEDLAEYLNDLEEEIARVRRELERMRESGSVEG
jgi:hypothetical protein